MTALCKEGVVRDFDVIGPKCDLLNCPCCTTGKLARTVFRKQNTGGRPTKPLNLIHMDLMGPMDCKAQEKGQYMLILTDNATNHVWVYILKKKSEAEDTIMDWIAMVER